MNGKHKIGEAELRIALRALRRDTEPATDLWPSIAARLRPQARPVLRRSRVVWPVSLAASMVLAAGFAWRLGGPAAMPADGAGAGQAAANPLPAQVQALSAQYDAALREMDARNVPASWQPGLEALDRSAEQVLAALRHAPESTQLLEQLRQIYTRRLALSRRAFFT